MKKVTVNETVTSHERYLYRGYLQIAALDMLGNRNVLRTLLWNPLEPISTRPLALVQDASLYCYGWDFNKNVTEVFDGQGTVAAAYDYSPYGQVASTGDLVQPVQWSSEMNSPSPIIRSLHFFSNPSGSFSDEGSYQLHSACSGRLRKHNVANICYTFLYISTLKIGSCSPKERINP